MTGVATYETRRGEIETYFDRTAADTWKRLTSDAPLGRIRTSVRAGRDAMRDALLAMLPADLSGRRILEAGCGTGALSIEAARRGAEIVAIDLSPTLVAHAAAQAGEAGFGKQIRFIAGDMLDGSLGRFDHVVLMDSLIHYDAPDAVAALATLAMRTDGSIVFTVAPKTPALTLMHMTGRLFPRADRAPSIVPVEAGRLAAGIEAHPALAGWDVGRDSRITSFFYKSHARELVRA